MKALLGLDFVGGAVAVPLQAEGYLVTGWTTVVLLSITAGAIPSLLSRRLGPRPSPGVLLTNVVVGATWSGVFGSGVGTTAAAYLVPALIVLAGSIWVSRDWRREGGTSARDCARSRAA